MTMPKIEIVGCNVVAVSANRDKRGCLFEVYRQSWPNAFPTVQWNACASNAGVVRGAHVHVDYDEFYTLPFGRVLLGLADIRRASPSYRKAVQIEWAAKDGFAVTVPRGVAHVVVFEENSVLAFGLSDYWNPEYDVVGCQWDDPELGFVWSARPIIRSERDTTAGNYEAMLKLYEDSLQAWGSGQLGRRTGKDQRPLRSRSIGGKPPI
jgi:dTDP-4-dehydrorhamnose 3,5-epimerase